MRSLGWALIQTCLVTLKGEVRTQTHTEGRPREDTGRRWPSTRQGERNGPCPHPALGPPASEVWGVKRCCLRPGLTLEPCWGSPGRVAEPPTNLRPPGHPASGPAGDSSIGDDGLTPGHQCQSRLRAPPRSGPFLYPTLSRCDHVMKPPPHSSPSTGPTVWGPARQARLRASPPYGGETEVQGTHS